jgi:hypothetical protein
MFTDEELTTALDKIVRTSIRKEYGDLGNRRTDLTFSDVQDAAAGVFISNDKAVFYVLLLAAARLRKRSENLRVLTQEMADTCLATGRDVLPIEDMSSLANVNQALNELTSASAARTSLARVEDFPAYQRFDQNTQRFLDNNGRNIRYGGGIVRTPEQARSLLGSQFSAIQTEWAAVVRLATLIAAGVTDYEAMNLPQSFVGSIMNNAKTVLQSRYDELSVLTPKQRLEVIRGVTLDVLTARAAIRGFGSFAGPTTFHVIEGTGGVFADADHPAVPAALYADLYGSYPITDTLYDLDFKLDGDAGVTVSIAVQGSFIAKAETTITETYDVGSPNGAGVDNDELRIQLVNYPTVGTTRTYNVAFATSALKRIWDVCTEINNAINLVGLADPLIAEPYLQPQKWAGEVDITIAGVSDVRLTSTNPSLDFTNLDGAGTSIEVGDWIIVRDPTSTNDEQRLVVFTGGVSPTFLDCQIINPVVPSWAEAGIQVEIGEELALRLRITDEAGDNGYALKVDYQYEALRDRVAILIPEDGPVDKDMQFNAASTLGLLPLMEFRSAPTTAEDVASSVTKSGSNNTYVGGQRARVEVGYEFVATQYTGTGHTNPNNFLEIVASDFQGVGDVTAGINVVFTVAGAATAGVGIGDIVVMRSSSTLADVNQWGTITGVTDTTISATMQAAVTADTGIDIECGPNLLSPPNDTVVVVSEGDGNDGTYIVKGGGDANGDTPLDLNINTPFPYPNTTGNQGVDCVLEVGQHVVFFKTLDTSLSSSIEMNSYGNTASAISRFFTTLPASEPTLTSYFQLPEWPTGLEEGDLLELYDTDPSTPDVVRTITGLEESERVIQLASGVNVLAGNYPMTTGSVIPFSRIRKAMFNNFVSFEENISEWVDQPQNLFRQIQSNINSLLVNKKPTAAQLNSAVSSVNDLTIELGVLEGYINSYTSDIVPEVDVLLDSFREKGADRALDILLEGRFADFFGLSQEEVSYAGVVQRAVREVSREDLPIRKTGRGFNDEIIASYDEPDFEFDQSDIDDDAEVDIPGNTSNLGA